MTSVITDSSLPNTPPAAPKNDSRKWRATAVAGLYQRDNGNYYSRYSIGGKRTWRCLDTDDYAVARLAHVRSLGGIEVARQTGVTINSDLRTLGALADRFLSEVDLNESAPATKKQYRIALDRLRDNWPGDFSTALARSVDWQTILKLRRHLQTVPFKVGKTVRKGYTNAAINQSLNCLRLILTLGVKNHAIAANPLSERGLFGETVYLSRRNRRPVLPTNDQLERVFVELETPPEGALPYIVRQHVERARFARFLAYSGFRLNEAISARFEDVGENTILCHGTKTETSTERHVAIIPPLRKLLESIRQDRKQGRILAINDCRDHLRRACVKLGLPHIRHHDLRHYFATACLESGVDVGTVADWLGHADGGALLLRTYRHLRIQHSAEAAQRVTLQTPAQSTAS